MEEGGVNNAENDSMEEGRVNNSGENDSMEEGGLESSIIMDSQLCLNIFTREMKHHDNPHLTFETLVLRLFKRVSHSFHLPWSHVLEVSRQAPYLMDSHLHQDLLKIWTLRSKNATLDEQHCFEHILGRDNVR
ncbi:uncharacterized protein TNCT_443281 [Trichonephila clavata]|uniref:Uncharacterized protein n=1 Tax=Trichonephila clavata TaxID=2740835 RepID=A0A8X6K5U5_TRICU|nr:uncharacterized protein TNCT_443281 [Trichonephila clavata]